MATIGGPIPQTGELQFGNTRSGVFIRNEDAIVWAADLRKAVKEGDSIPWTTRTKLEELAQLFESVK